MSDQERLDLARAAAGGCVNSARRLLAMLERANAPEAVTYATRVMALPVEFFSSRAMRNRVLRALGCAYALRHPGTHTPRESLVGAIAGLTIGDVAREFSHDFLLSIQGCGRLTAMAIESMCDHAQDGSRVDSDQSG